MSQCFTVRVRAERPDRELIVTHAFEWHDGGIDGTGLDDLSLELKWLDLTERCGAFGGG